MSADVQEKLNQRMLAVAVWVDEELDARTLEVNADRELIK